jgi:predicted phage baseplate assembly protein
MPLTPPILDDRRFDDLVREARERIVRYVPDWTDFNDSDPGMTIVQLFAWMTELMLFRLNQVPDLNYVKFLQLLNLELQPARPARAAVTFVPKLKTNDNFTTIRKNAQVRAEPAEGGQPLIFETEDDVNMVRRPLKSIQVFDGSTFNVIRDTLDEEPTFPDSFFPLGRVPQVGNALYLGFQLRADEQLQATTEGRIFPSTMRLRVFRPPPPSDAVHECHRRFRLAPAARLVWEYRHPDNVGHWQRMDLLRDDTDGFTREGYILLEGPPRAAATAEGKIRPDAQQPQQPRLQHRYWIRCRLESGSYPENQIPQIEAVLPNTVDVLNLTTAGPEFLGVSEGVPDQIFEVPNTPIAADTLELEVRPQSDAQRARTWTRVDDFLASDNESQHYTLNPNTGEIRFGDGQHGAIPPAGAEIVARTYRYGGGEAGNVGADRISQLAAPPPQVERATNYRAAAGGKNEQTLAELRRQAPSLLRSRGRAVTRDDYSVLASRAPGVLAAKAVPLCNPNYPDVEVPGAVTVVIVPDSSQTPPLASREMLREVCRFLDERRLLTTELFIRQPDFIPLSVVATITSNPRASADRVKKDVENAIDDLLNPFGQAAQERKRRRRREEQARQRNALGSGDGESLAQILELRLGKPFYPTTLFDVILDVDDVERVDELFLRVNDNDHNVVTDPVPVSGTGMIYGAEPQITVRPIQP